MLNADEQPITGPGLGPRFARAPEGLRRRMLAGYLVILVVVYGLAAGLQYIPPGADRYDVRGEILATVVAAVGLGCGAAPLLRGRRYAVTVACAGAAPVVAMVFHDQLAAQAWAVVPLMFMAMFLRTWHGVGAARAGAAALAGAAVATLLIAPAPVPPLWLIFYVVSILGAAEVFGVASAALVDMALRDPLTGLWNRAGIDRELPILVARAQRTSAPIAVLVFDIDNFKTINDRHGHPAGDEALSLLAHTLVGRLPKPALLGRLGGDEFVVVAAGYDHSGAHELADSLVDGHTVEVSFGVAVSPPQTFDITSIFARADADLYRRKRQRKDGGTTCE